MMAVILSENNQRFSTSEDDEKSQPTTVVIWASRIFKNELSSATNESRFLMLVYFMKYDTCKRICFTSVNVKITLFLLKSRFTL